MAMWSKQRERERERERERGRDRESGRDRDRDRGTQSQRKTGRISPRKLLFFIRNISSNAHHDKTKGKLAVANFFERETSLERRHSSWDFLLGQAIYLLFHLPGKETVREN